MSEDFLEGLSLHSDRYVRIHLSVMQQREVAREEHRTLLEHARTQDINKAVALLELHILRSKEELLAMVAALREQNKQKS
jgi:DNA-binding GntR family transcriptional regulator